MPDSCAITTRLVSKATRTLREGTHFVLGKSGFTWAPQRGITLFYSEQILVLSFIHETAVRRRISILADSEMGCVAVHPPRVNIGSQIAHDRW